MGGLQFDLIAMPTIITLSGATPVDQNNFSADYTVFNDGSGRVVYYNSVGGAIAPGGNDVVLNLHYDGSDILSAIVQLEAYDLSVSDGDGDVYGVGDGCVDVCWQVWDVDVDECCWL